MNMLSAHNLVKSYGARKVVSGVSMQINSGEIIGLLGPNGAGKTTSFYMIVGLVPADKGQISINDKVVTGFPMHARAQMGIGYLPQEASIFKKLTVEENILAILQTRDGLHHNKQTRILDGLLLDFNLGHLRKNFAMSLSGGERRRLEIARALAANPQFILLDEPFAGVDPISVIDIQRIISHLCERGIGVLITDHNVRETLKICNRAYIISAGKVIADGHPNDVLNNAQVREVYLGEDFTL